MVPVPCGIVSDRVHGLHSHAAKRNGSPPAEHIAYLTGLYPAVSHTFVLREVLALRAAGLRVSTCSVNTPAPEHLIGPDERAEAASTFHLLAQARNPWTLLASLARVMARPRRLARALWAVRRSGARDAGGRLRHLIHLGEAVVLARFLERQGVTRIHNQLGMASASVSLYASILAAIPFSFSLHGPDDFHDEPARQMAAKIAAADIVACISGFCRNRAASLSDSADWPKLHIVRCGIDPALYGNAARTGPARRILFVGRLVPAKGVSVLLDAFGRIDRDFPDAVLTIVGDGAGRASLEAMARDRGWTGRVVFAGALNQAQVAARMAEADLFVLPSFAEGLPVVLMEAMASGLPVIATRIAGIPELVEDGVTGRLVGAGDADGLAKAIADHLSDPRPARDMIRQARIRVLRDHDMWTEGNRLAHLFRDARDGGEHPAHRPAVRC